MVTCNSNSLLNIKLETTNLVLRPISLDDQSDIFKFFTEYICENMDNKPFSNGNELQKFIKYHIAQIEFRKFLTLTARKGEKFVGTICLSNINSKVPEFGLWVAEHCQNQGFGKEMLQAVYQWALDQNRFDYLLYPAVTDNIPSRKLAEYIGGHYLYHQKEMVGSFLKTVMYYHVPTFHDLTKN